MKRYTVILLIFMIIGLSCKKFIELDAPKDQLTTVKVFDDKQSATSSLVNIYALFDRVIDLNYSKLAGLYTDEIDYSSTNVQDIEFWESVISPTNLYNLNLWKGLYLVIYQCNDILDRLPKSSIPIETVATMSNEAKFLRAFAYFYLVNLYENIPLLLTTDVNQNRIAVQNSPDEIYEQIIIDLNNAIDGLLGSFNEGKVRANKWAAAALLARVYLMQGDWENAEKQSNLVVSSGLYDFTDPLEKVFQAGSQEGILQFWTQEGYITGASSLVPSSDISLPGYTISKALYDAFEEDDLRKSSWIGTNAVGAGNITSIYHYPKKYKNRTTNLTNPEYRMALRLAEQYLIRSEARAQQGDLVNALLDLNTIRSRAGLLEIITNNQEELILAIEKERQLELFMEWGNRFLDLKRKGKLNDTMGDYKSTWLPHAVLFPIPQVEIIYNPNLIQNKDYN